MKKLKKTAVLLTVLALALSLSACGESELAGTWEGRLDMSQQAAARTEAALEGFAPAGDTESGTPELKDCMGGFSFGYTIVFSEDGSFSAGADEEELAACLESLRESIKEYYRQRLFVSLSRTAEEMGLASEVSGPEQLESLMGVSLDEAISEVLGVDLEELAELALAELRAGLSGLELEGSCESGDGELVLYAGPDAGSAEAAQLSYVLEGDRLSLRAPGAGYLFGLEGLSSLELSRAS